MTDWNEMKVSEVVALPGWRGERGETFVCELKRPSILTLAAKGAITNPLMKTARRIFYSGVSPSEGNLEEEGRVLLTIAKAAMVAPTYDELEAHGVELTDEQLIAIFRFTQWGVKALDRFRQLSADYDGADGGAALSHSAE